MASVPFIVAAFAYVASVALGVLALASMLVYGDRLFGVLFVSWFGLIGSGIVMACGKPRIAHVTR